MNKKIISRKVQSLHHYKKGVKNFEALTKCTNDKKDIKKYRKCIFSNLAATVSTSRADRIAKWLLEVKDYKKAFVCNDETLDSFPFTAKEKFPLVLCFNFVKRGETKVGVIYYAKERGEVRINGIQE